MDQSSNKIDSANKVSPVEKLAKMLGVAEKDQTSDQLISPGRVTRQEMRLAPKTPGAATIEQIKNVFRQHKAIEEEDLGHRQAHEDYLAKLMKSGKVDNGTLKPFSVNNLEVPQSEKESNPSIESVVQEDEVSADEQAVLTEVVTAPVEQNNALAAGLPNPSEAIVPEVAENAAAIPEAAAPKLAEPTVETTAEPSEMEMNKETGKSEAAALPPVEPVGESSVVVNAEAPTKDLYGQGEKSPDFFQAIGNFLGMGNRVDSAAAAKLEAEAMKRAA